MAAVKKAYVPMPKQIMDTVHEPLSQLHVHQQINSHLFRVTFC